VPFERAKLILRNKSAKYPHLNDVPRVVSKKAIEIWNELTKNNTSPSSKDV
jgi:hypothetical protein